MRDWAVFSGRFDPPNAGHFMTIEKLCCEYAGVVVVILSEPREACLTGEAIAIFNWHFDRVLPDIAKNKVEVVPFPIHFGKITKPDLSDFADALGLNSKNATYVAGNLPVLEHIESLGVIPTRFIPRVHVSAVSDEYLIESRRIRKKMSAGETLEQQNGIDFHGN
jgi:hypothetical protein